MKKILLLFLIILSFSFLISCTKENDNDKSTITDMIGREVEVKLGSYKRVVCIGAGALRMYSYIGEMNLLVGVEDIENETLDNRPKTFDGVARPYFIAYKDVFSKLPSCGVGGPQAQTAEAEKILSCNPDIVISEYEDVNKEDALQSQLGIPVITLNYGNQGIFDEKVKSSLTMLGKIFNKEKQASTLNDYIEENKNEIISRTKNITEKPKTYICGLGNWGTTNHLMTSQNYGSFNICNIENVIEGLTKDGIQEIDEEKFVSIGKEIDIMIIDSAAIKNIKPLLEENPDLFSNCKAWQNNEVYLQMAYNAYYTNLEISLANTWFNAKVVYPSLFTDIDMNIKLNEITKAFLGKELANEINNYQNSFGGYQKININSFFD